MAGVNRSADATVAAWDAVAVTLSDSTVIPVTRALYIGTGGTLKVRMAATGNLVTFANVSAGVFPIQVDQVWTTTTTASSIVALY